VKVWGLTSERPNLPEPSSFGDVSRPNGSIPRGPSSVWRTRSNVGRGGKVMFPSRANSLMAHSLRNGPLPQGWGSWAGWVTRYPTRN